MDGSKLNRGKLLGVSIALSRYLRKTFPAKRIAIVLPASKGAVVANLAVALANKIPVGLNFTSGPAAVQSCCDRANLRVAITANAFMQRLTDFPWPQEIVKLDELVPAMTSPVLGWWILCLVVPTPLLLRLLHIPKQGGHAEAVLLFTSGSSG